MFVLTVACLVIGAALGGTGFGGFLVPVLFVVIFGWDTSTGVLHGLIATGLAGLVAAGMHWRQASPTARPGLVAMAGWICLGVVPGTVVGRGLVEVIDDGSLRRLVGMVVIVAGVAVVWVDRLRRGVATGASPSAPMVRATAIGSGVVGGIATVTAGVGGPLITIPALLLVGLATQSAITASIFAALAAIGMAVAALLVQPSTPRQLDGVALVVSTAALMAGAVLGTRLVRRLPARAVVWTITALSVGGGLWLVST